MSNHAVYFDVDGNLIDGPGPTMATGEVTVTDADGNVVRRDYIVGPAYPGVVPPLNDTADLVDDVLDGPAGPFDLTTPDGTPVTDFATLVEALGGSDIPDEVMDERLFNVTLLPSWVNAPEDLQTAVDAHLEA